MTDSPRYWPFYCEENVWWLSETAPQGSKVVFVSNPRRAVVLHHQRAAQDGIGPVIWDYHVILLVPEAAGGWAVLDLDSTLGERVPARDYFERTFAAADQLPAPLRPGFRLLDAAAYRTQLRSDRSHMRRSDGSYGAAPPPWPPIGDGPQNLMRFVDLALPFVGEVIDLDELRARFE